MRHVDIRKREQQQHGRKYEAQPRNEPAADTVQFPAEEDRELQRFGTRQQHAEVQRSRELAVVEPATTLDDLAVEDGNLAGGATEGNEAEIRPEAGCFAERRRWTDGWRRHGRKYHDNGVRTSRKRPAPPSSDSPRAIR